MLLLAATACFGQANSTVHTLHAAKLGRLECNLCHLPAAKGSVTLKRPGHDQCKLCHEAAFREPVATKICAECHEPKTTHPKLSAAFSHDRHVDPKARIDAAGIRADCGFCHKPSADGRQQRIPSHTQCAACHAKVGMHPELNGFVRAASCRGCHAPEQAELAATAKPYAAVRFSHASHRVECATCHANHSKLPRMADCAGCHESARRVSAALRMSNCSACHLETARPGAMLSSFNRNVRPQSHSGNFRVHHDDAASASGANCFACHQNMVASSSARNQCVACHTTMKPVSHTARWKDNIHGKYAALDRATCATCHSSETCSRCHNELPRSHVPLPVFKAGGHAALAMMDTRACFTCHTYQNTCSTCHVDSLRTGRVHR